jgi:hypothetical protein
MEDSMANEKNPFSVRGAIRWGSCLCLLCSLAVARAHGQDRRQQSEAYQRAERRFQNLGSVADAIKKVKQGDFLGVHVEEIAEAGAGEAIPALKEQFARNVDPSQKDDIDPGNKGKIASALVRLGDKDEVYWDFLVKQAKEAIESDPPFPREFDFQGNMLTDHFSTAFLQWAKVHELSSDKAAEMAMYKLPGKLLLIAETGDQRGLPLLRQAMSSSNFVIQAMAAKGLAKLQDKESIPLIIAACQKSPGGASAIAEALVYFDDPQAQNAAGEYMPKDMFKAFRENRHEPIHDPFAQ